jgi:hypothetical protein
MADEPPDPAVGDCGPWIVEAVPAEDAPAAGAVRVCAARFDGVVELLPPALASAAALLAGFARGVGLACESTTERGGGAGLLATMELPYDEGRSWRSTRPECVEALRGNSPAVGPLEATASAAGRARGSTPPTADGDVRPAADTD